MIETIKEISTSDTFLVRYPVLRAGKPLESCRFKGDDLATTKHFGLFVDKNLVGVISAFENKSDSFIENRQFQIRGMAVLSSEQGKGFGEKLLGFVEDYVRNQKGDLIWFNARSIAVVFYEKYGYTITGNAFEIPEVGTHYIMYKTLDNSFHVCL